jgi:nucleoside-diphosphate-sugar epimerase
MEIVVFGVNGFIGSHLSTAILEKTDWTIYGMDLRSDRIARWTGHPRFRFHQGDVAADTEWIDTHLRTADVCVPLAATATPALYLKDPLGIFELNFEQNVNIARRCVVHGTRIVFPSTSEIYGMCPDDAFDEETSPLVYGPVGKTRWIYACGKQLLERVIVALGREQGLRYTLFRPFNWIGPDQDSIDASEPGSSRVVTQFLGHLLRDEPVTLVDGGVQRRSFTYIDDGIDALLRILQNDEGCADGQIFNLGNPGNDRSIRDLAETMVRVLATFPGQDRVAREAHLIECVADDYYGPEYQDVARRVPSITRAREILGWTPKVDFEEAIRRTIAHYLSTAATGTSTLMKWR